VNLPAKRGPSFGDWLRGSLVGWSEEEEFDHEPLLAKRQALGIVPTFSFWTRRITWKVQFPAIVVALGTTAALGALGFGAMAGLLGVGSGLGVLGLTERKVRKQMLSRGLKASEEG
jgi:hypothetical protein